MVRPESSVVAAMAPKCELGCAYEAVEEKTVKRKEVAAKAVINVVRANCRRFDIRVRDRPKDTLT